MQPIQKVTAFAESVDVDGFLAKCTSPVLVARQIIGGRLGRTRAHFNRQSAPGGRMARLKPATLMHIEPQDINDPRADDIMVTRPLNREMWVPLMKGAATPRHTPITIGRAASCDVVINDYTVSKRHAFFQHDPLLLKSQLTDAGSTNGTRVDEKWLDKGDSALIQSFHFVTVGRLICMFLTPTDFYNYLCEGEPEPRAVEVMLG